MTAVASFWNIRSSRELSIVHSRPCSYGADIITIRSHAAKTEQPLISNYFLGIWSAWARTWRSFNLSATCPKSWHSSCGGASWPRGPSRRRCRRASGCLAGSSRCRPATSASRPSPRWPRVPRVRYRKNIWIFVEKYYIYSILKKNILSKKKY